MVVKRKFTIQEKVEVVEHFIAQWRPARNVIGERDVYLILKEIASELRARNPGSGERASARIERAIQRAQEAKGPDGYFDKDMRKIAEVVISEWRTIRQALEKFEEEVSQ